MSERGEPLSTDGSMEILSSLTRDERLARAMVIGVPAFVRRARAVETAEQALLALVARERDERLRSLVASGRELDAFRRGGAQLPRAIAAVLEELKRLPQFDRPEEPPRVRGLARALSDFARRIERFNERWARYLREVPLDRVHEAQQKYNRYYALEREMALRGVPLRPFRPLALFARDALFERFPLLPISE